MVFESVFDVAKYPENIHRLYARPAIAMTF
jgi:hypothetical protein